MAVRNVYSRPPSPRVETESRAGAHSLPSFIVYFILLFIVCVHADMPQHVWSEDNLQDLGFPFHCMGLGYHTEVTKLGVEDFCPPGHPVCPFLLFKIGLFLLTASFRAAACVPTTLPLSDTWFANVVLYFVFLFPWVNFACS